MKLLCLFVIRRRRELFIARRGNALNSARELHLLGCRAAVLLLLFKALVHRLFYEWLLYDFLERVMVLSRGQNPRGTQQFHMPERTE